MAFVCTLTADQPLIFAKIREGSDVIRQVDVGYDDTTGALISAIACLSPLPGHYPDGFELVFNVVQAATDEDPTFFRDGGETRHLIIDALDRNMVLRSICLLVHSLIRDERPLRIDMITHEPDLPRKALTKYEMVCATVASLGYKAGRADPYHGRHIWMMERLDA